LGLELGNTVKSTTTTRAGRHRNHNVSFLAA
jgi:hypothetical protein